MAKSAGDTGVPVISYDAVSFIGGDRNGGGGRLILSRFNLDIYSGEKVLIFGPSGTGKTTLFRLLLGFTEASEGRVLFKGVPVGGKNVWDVRSSIGYVPQSPDLGEGKTEEILTEFINFKKNRSLGIAVEDMIKDMEKNLVSLGLPETIMKESFEGLSGGEKQRIGYAAAVLLGREVLLLDEPTASMDAALKKQIIAQTESFDKNRTVIVISHDPEWKASGVFRVVEIGMGA